MRKAIPALLLIILLSLLGCANQNPQSEPAEGLLDPANPITITLWHYYNDENQKTLEQTVAYFNQSLGIERGVIVEPVAKGRIGDLEVAVTNSAKGIVNAEPMPDIFSCYTDKALEIDSLGKLCDMTTCFTEEEIKQYVPDFIVDGSYQDERLLVLPIVKSTELIYMNADAWQDFAQSQGYTTDHLASWQGIYQLAQAYYQWSGGKSFISIDSPVNYIIIGNKQLGVDIIDGAGRQAVLDKAVLRQIFTPYYQAMCLGHLGQNNTFGSDEIKKDTQVAYVGSSSSAAYFPTWIEENNTQKPIELLPLPYPVFAGVQPYVVQQGAGMCMAKSTPIREEGAALFLKWFTSVDQNISFAMGTGYLPVQLLAYENDYSAMKLSELCPQDVRQQNLAKVYDITLNQITASTAYAPQPFKASYKLRQILKDSMQEIIEAGIATAAPLRNQGLSEAEILQALDTDAQFVAWLKLIQDKLAKDYIPYIEQ